MSKSSAVIKLMLEKNLAPQQTAVEIAGILNANSIERRDTALYNTAALIERLGLEDVAYALGVLEAVTTDASPADQGTKILLRNTLVTINTAGINFASTSTRAILDQLVASGVFDPAKAERFKAIGITSTSPAYLTFGESVSEPEVQEAIDWLLAEQDKEKLLRDATSRWNNVLSAISSEQATTMEQVIAVFGV